MSLKSNLDANAKEWEIIFDYLVFKENLLFKCVANNLDFFADQYVEHGNEYVRGLLSVTEQKYDNIWQPVFDFVSIAHENLRNHILHNRVDYLERLDSCDIDELRGELNIDHARYDGYWKEVLEILLSSMCERMVNHRDLEQGITAFTRLYNENRTQRKIS
jgi:hypothetical protein